MIVHGQCKPWIDKPRFPPIRKNSVMSFAIYMVPANDQQPFHNLGLTLIMPWSKHGTRGVVIYPMLEIPF